MSRLLTLSRAARLVGVRRGVLQQRVKDGELATFEGMIALADLLRAYPDTHVVDDTMLERVEQIKRDAIAKRIREPAPLPDADILAHRVTTLGRELAETTAKLSHFTALIDRLRHRLEAYAADPDPRTRTVSGSLNAWLSEELQAPLPTPEAPADLVARDMLLRVVAAQVQIIPGDHEFFVMGKDSLLEAGLRAGIPLAYGCSDGSCGRCRARIVAGEIRRIGGEDPSPADSTPDPAGILMCQHAPVSDLEIEAEVVHGPVPSSPRPSRPV